MQLFYRRYGQGRPYVILHGMFEMSDNWVPVARALARDYDVIIPDLRNHGRSPHHSEHTYEAMAKDIEELAGDLGLERFVLQGFSMGGRLAMYYTYLHPGQVEKLIIIDISPRAYTREEFFKEVSCVERFEKMASLDLSRFSSREEIARVLDGILDNPRLTQVMLKNIKLDGGQYKWKFNLQAINANYDRLREQVLPPDARIDLPVLLIYGEKSKYVQQQDLDFMRKVFPQLTTVKIPGATHFLPIEKPAEMMAAIFKFLKQK